MKGLLSTLLVLLCFLVFPHTGKAQVEISMKARATAFQGKFGDNYVGIGYEPSVTLQPGKFWAGGVGFSENLLGGYNDLSGKMTLINFHAGAKRSLSPYIHPFIYALAGFRFTEYNGTDDFTSDEEPLLSPFSLNYGLRSGVQIGKGRWRFEGILELTSGTKSRYLTPESFERANSSGGEYRDYAEKSMITGLTAGIGISYVLDWTDIVEE